MAKERSMAARFPAMKQETARLRVSSRKVSRDDVRDLLEPAMHLGLEVIALRKLEELGK
jgi:hypothetical protein